MSLSLVATQDTRLLKASGLRSAVPRCLCVPHAARCKWKALIHLPACAWRGAAAGAVRDSGLMAPARLRCATPPSALAGWAAGGSVMPVIFV